MASMQLLDLYLVQPRHFGWVGQVEGLECAANNPCHDRIAIPFAVRRYDKPGRPRGAAARQSELVRRHVIVPIFAFGEIAGAEFPSLGGIVEASLEPRALLFF